MFLLYMWKKSKRKIPYFSNLGFIVTVLVNVAKGQCNIVLSLVIVGRGHNYFAGQIRPKKSKLNLTIKNMDLNVFTKVIILCH